MMGGGDRRGDAARSGEPPQETVRARERTLEPWEEELESLSVFWDEREFCRSEAPALLPFLLPVCLGANPLEGRPAGVPGTASMLLSRSPPARGGGAGVQGGEGGILFEFPRSRGNSDGVVPKR
mmetsp:Transcript_46708/g.117053  ORF Transcript_46708/g.117053 Transcript_46708/m.117053 type:complete len:124 (+) Transcript_46708:56-427(+)